MAELNQYEVDVIIHVTHLEVQAKDETAAKAIAKRDLSNRFPQAVATHLVEPTRVRMLAEGVTGNAAKDQLP